ncbi:MAG: FtsX-like permease family protein, partial [Bacteroidota bacterium]
KALARSLNWENPMGKPIWYGGEMRTVIGVADDFHNKSLHNLIEPIVFLYEDEYARKLLVKSSTIDATFIQTTWKDFYPASPFSLTYFDQFIDEMYQNENQLIQLFSFFSFISVLLCCTGLFALFSFHVLQRYKEISIRKILGANAWSLFKSITKDFSLVAILSIVLAIPIAWTLLSSWLELFSYNVNIGIDIYLVAGLVILLASLLVIAFHLYKILKVNPVDALKSE